MSTPHDAPAEPIEAARLPAAALAGLAALRREPGVTVAPADADGGRVWVRWPAGSAAVRDAIRPLPGVELYTRRGGLWYRLGRRLPAFDVPPDADPLALHAALVPRPIRPEDPAAEASIVPVALRLVRDETPRAATALECPLEALARWIDLAPSSRWSGLEAAVAGGRVLVRGRTLPPIAGASRSWGDRVLTPLGFRPEPALPEAALLAACGAGAGGLLVLGEGGYEVVPRAALRPLSRAGVRLALGGPPS
jgi:hypothetical protein